MQNNVFKHQRDIVRAQVNYHVDADHESKSYRCLTKWRRFESSALSKVQAMLLTVQFEVLILITVTITFFAVGLTIPQYEGGPAHTACTIILLCCNSVFTVEVLLKMFAWGLWRYKDPRLPRKPFFRVWQNVLDLVLCILQWARPNSGFFSSLRFAKRGAQGRSCEAVLLFVWYCLVLSGITA